MSFKPLQDRVLVRRLEEEETTSGGIIIPDTAKEKPQKGEIVAVGPGIRQDDGNHVPLAVETGEHVLFAKWAGTEIAIDREEYVVMRESDILGVLEDEDSSRRKAA